MDPDQIDQKKQRVVNAYVGLAKAYRSVTEALVEFYQAMADPNGGEQMLDFSSLEEVMVAGELFSQTLLGKRKRPVGGAPEKKRKRERDPNAPKRPASAFIEFQNDVRQKYREQNPGLPYKDVMSLISAAWSNLPEPDRKKYQDITQEKTLQFEEAKKAYELHNGSHGGSDDEDASDDDKDEEKPK